MSRTRQRRRDGSAGRRWRGSLAAAGVLAAVAAVLGLACGAAAASPAVQQTGVAQQTGRTVVTFTWGGGLADQMGALPIFQKFRMHATFYVPSGLVCQPSADPGCTHMPYLTLTDVRQIAADGNEIGGLSVEHVPLTGLPRAEAQREICDDRMNLTRWGFRVTDFAYPFAQVSRPLQELVRRCGYNSGLGTGQLRGAGRCNSCAFAETIPPLNAYLLRAPIEVASVGTIWSPATFEQIVTGARRHGGGWIIFTIHDVCAHTCSLGVTRPELRSVLSWLSRQADHGVSVETVRQVVGGPVRHAVPGPRPPRLRGSGVVNSRLTAAAAGGIPACFQTSQFGANRATFQYRPHAGPGGAGAEFVSLSRRRSGTAQLLPTLDLGACAPTVSAGRPYTLGVWYKATKPVVFNAYYRTPLGTWKFWVTSPPISASSGWTLASWTTPAVPPGASALSFGLAPSSAGTVATTRYSLAAAAPSRIGVITLGVVLAAIVALVGRPLLRRRGRV